MGTTLPLLYYHGGVVPSIYRRIVVPQVNKYLANA